MPSKRSLRLAVALAAALVPADQLVRAEPDAQPIRDLVGRYAAAREARDETALRTVLADEADQLVSSGAWRRGREELVEGMRGSTQRRPGSRTLAVETVRFVTADTAVADARYIIAASRGSAERRMWSTFVCVRTEQGWKIAAIRNMLPAP